MKIVYFQPRVNAIRNYRTDDGAEQVWCPWWALLLHQYAAPFADGSDLIDARLDDNWCAALVPLHHQLLSRALRRPPALRHDRDAGEEAGQLCAALHHEHAANAWLRLDGIEVRGDDLAAEHRALLIHGVEHARQFRVDPEQRFAGDDCVVVEVKAVERANPLFQAQLLTYLRVTGKPIGLLLNFNSRLLKDGIMRLRL